jgi:hypothetical protein
MGSLFLVIGKQQRKSPSKRGFLGVQRGLYIWAVSGVEITNCLSIETKAPNPRAQ